MVTHYDVRLLHKKEVAEHTLEFTLEKPQGFEYRAGQFGDIVLPASTGLDESHNKHGFSFASAPFEDTLRMATLMRPSKFKQAAAQVPDGTVVGLLALWGSFTLHKNADIPAVFITSGIGITPVRGIIAQATHEQARHDITLIYANASRAQTAYHEEFVQLAARNPHFRYLPVFTQAQGPLTAEALRSQVNKLAAAIVYLSGAKSTIASMRALALQAGADEDQLRTEEFEGY